MKNTLEDLIRLAIHFEGRTAFPVPNTTIVP